MMIHMPNSCEVLKEEYFCDGPDAVVPSPEEQGGESIVGGVMAPVVTPPRPWLPEDPIG